jgi:uncharacterized protein YggE
MPRTAAAQPDAGASERSISVVGFGEAEAPAETAIMQFTLSLSDPFIGPPQRQRAGAVPGAEEREAVTPVVDVLVANGVTADDVEIVTSLALAGPYQPGGAGVVLVRFPVSQPTHEGLNELVDTVLQAASDEGLFLLSVGARYEVADCAPVQRQAREAALADARAQADVQAELLGVELGEVVGSSDMPIVAASLYAVPLSTDSCDPAAPEASAILGPGLAATLPAYDPTTEPAVEVYQRVSVTFAIA